MAEAIIMPKAGMAMEEGVVAKWFKKEGDRIEKGEAIAEIETDKVTMDLEADFAGVLIKIVRGDGETVPVTKTIGWIGEAGEVPPEIPDEDDAPAEAAAPQATAAAAPVAMAAPVAASGCRVPIAATPAARKTAADKGVDLATVTPTGTSGEVVHADVENLRAVKATPLARKIAADQGIDLSNVAGSGFGGKIFKGDLGNTVVPADRRETMTGVRKVIADRMSLSHQTVPAATLMAKADVTQLCELRTTFNLNEGVKITFNDFVLKAVATALREFPAFNAWIDGNDVVYKGTVNVGIAVALENGLVVPVLKNVDQLPLRALSAESKALTTTAREGKLPPDAYAEGTFTITNLGMFDITAFSPIINVPEVAILGVCSIEDVVKMIDDQPVVRKVMGLTVTIDHRLIDGAQAAIFLTRITEQLENPMSLVAWA